VINKNAGAAVAAPVLVSKTHNSITIEAVTAPDNGQTVEYAISTTDAAPSAGWQDGLTFGELTASTQYYIFARSKGNDAYNVGAASASLAVTTDEDTNTWSEFNLAATSLKAWMRNGLMHVSGLVEGETFSVFNAAGAVIYRGVATGEEADIAISVQGVYIIQSGNRTVKISVF
jgi:hypothetical protein